MEKLLKTSYPELIMSFLWCIKIIATDVTQPEKNLNFYKLLHYKTDHLCGLVVRVAGYWKEMYCVSCEVRTELIYVM
jgi:hypothetical protein